MEEGRKRIRICLICVVLTAIVLGVFYYYYEMQGEITSDEGTLVQNCIEEVDAIWQR